MKSYQQKSKSPQDAATSQGLNANAVEAIASPAHYPKVGQDGKEKSALALPAVMPLPRFAQSPRAGAREASRKYGPNTGAVTLAALSGRSWTYRGKRARVVTMLVEMPGGVTQWDCLPWHTRLGGTIHALRRDGLDISTELEGDWRHARYRLCTRGCLIKQAGNSGEPVALDREAP